MYPLRSRHTTTLFLFAILTAFAASGSLAQGAKNPPQINSPGVTENVASQSDPSQHYAVFIPAAYRPDGTSPVLILMDPRGRAMIPLELVRDAAERYGFVALSSYDTLSDSDSAFVVNEKALTAMIADAKIRFSAHPSRVYLVGFSGTAHYSWTVAPRLDGKLAGIMGVGGGLPAYTDPMQRALKVLYPFVFFGIAGNADFNFDGVRFLDQSLDGTRFAHRFVTHDGDHSWPPKEIAEAGVEWFHLQAMRTGQIEKDDAFIVATLEKYLAEASALDASGSRADAYRRYREIVQDFQGLGGAPDAEKRFEALQGSRGVERELARREEIAREVIDYKLAVRDFYLDYREAKQLPTLEDALRRLKVEKLKKQTGAKDKEDQALALRKLATVFINAAFYEPRDYFKNKDYQRAAGMLRIAMAVKADVPRVCYQLARAAAQLNELDEAFGVLECGLKAEWATMELVEKDSLLNPLRMDPRFSELLSRSEIL